MILSIQCVFGIGFTAILLLHVLLRSVPKDIHRIREIDNDDSNYRPVLKREVIITKATLLVLVLVSTLIMFVGGIISDIIGEHLVAFIGITLTAIFGGVLLIFMIPYKKLASKA